MIFRVDELREKQVVSVKNGSVIGSVSDIEINFDTGRINALVIYGRPHFFGILGRENDIIIPFEQISVVGAETILVETEV